MDFTGANVVVTGAGSGIGASLAKGLRERGAATVTAADINATAVAEVAAAIGAEAATVDVSKPAEIEALIDRVEDEHGPIDLFCSNAGILRIGGVETLEDDWSAVMAINVEAHRHVARILVPRMIERGGGHLLATVSAAGLITQLGSLSYSVSKHAALALAEWVAITYGDKGIDMSVLCPQAVRTAMTTGSDEGGVAGLDGMLEPDDVANTALDGVAEGRFLILPHADVATYAQRRAADHDRWIGGMRRLQAQFPDGTGL